METNNIKQLDKCKFICDKCEYKCKFESEWLKHCNTELHKTGQRKKIIRKNHKQPDKCKNCDYETKNTFLMKKHILNEHSTKEQREKGFKFYCSYCDFGTFSKDTLDIHNNTNKHKNFVAVLNKNIK